MKIAGWMKISTVEHRGHFFKYCISKNRCKIIVSRLAIKINLSTKRDSIEESSNAELSLSEFNFFGKCGIRKCG